MKFDGWAGLVILVASLDACRGSYIGAEDCGQQRSCPVCECEECPVCSEHVDAGASASNRGATSGSGGGVAGESGSSGGEACALMNELPNPAFYVSFDDCDETTGSIEAKLGRSPYGLSLTTWTGQKEVFENDDLPCVEGKSGLAMQFGAGRVVFAGNQNVDLEHDATLSLWIRQDVEHVGALPAGAVGRWYNDDQFGLGVMGTTWTFTAAYTANEGPFTVSADVALGTWTHLVVVARRGGELELYKDGVLAPQADPVTLPTGFAFRPTLVDLSVGKLFWETWEPYFQGALDELRIYKTAFSAQEVAALHCSD